MELNNTQKIALLSILLVGVLSLMFYVITKPVTDDTNYTIAEVRDYGKALPRTYYDNKVSTSKSFFKNYGTENVTEFATDVDTESETNAAEYATEVGMTNIEYPNVALYEIADQCYQVYYGDNRVSPLFPLALANVETPGRADHNITWSALFPSRYVDIDLLETFNVCNVALEPERYGALMKERSTRDRGALQMSPTYGTKSEQFNSLMSGTEVEKLKESSWSPNAASWVQGASTMPGDRFYVKDVLYRLASAGTSAVTDMAKHNITIDSDAEAIVMLAMYHHRSGVWAVDGAGGWRPNGKSLEYVKRVTQQDQISRLVDYYNSNPTTFSISSTTAKKLINFDYNEYTTSSLEAVYPIQVLYAYTVLINLYG